MSLQTDFESLICDFENYLSDMGVDAEFDSTTGLMGLADKILEIEGSIGGLILSTSISCNVSSNTIYPYDNLIISGKLNASFDDISQANEDLIGFIQHGTVEIYNGDTLLGTTTTDNNGEYSYTYTPTTTGSLSIKAIYDGNNYYNDCYSSNVSVSVIDLIELELSSNKNVLNVYEDDSATITSTITLNEVGIPNQNVNLYCFNENTGLTLLDTLTTNNNGIATYTYKPSSVGFFDLILEYNGEYKTLEIEKCYYYNHGDTTTGLSIQSGVSCTSDEEWITITTSTNGEKFVYPPVCFTGTDEWEMSFQFNPVNYTSQAFGLQMENCNTWTYSGDSAYTSYSGISFNNFMGGGTVPYAMTSNDITTFRRSGGYWILLVNGTEIKRVSKNWTNQRVPGFYTNSGRVQHLKNIKINGLTSDGLFLYGDTSLSLADEDSTFLTAKIVDNGVSVSGVTVTFYKDNIIFGTGVTDSNGVAICDNVYESQGDGEITFTCTATVNNINLSSNTLTVIDMGLFSISSDKQVLSYLDGDSAIITVTLNSNGETVQLYANNQLLGNMTDNLDGTYSYTYNSQGKGEITFKAVHNNSMSTVTVSDIYKYVTDFTDWSSVSVKEMDYKFSDFTLPLNHRIEFKLKTNEGIKIACGDTTHMDSNGWLEWIYAWNNDTRPVYYRTSNNSEASTTPSYTNNSTSIFTIEYVDTDLKIYQDNTLLTNVTSYDTLNLTRLLRLNSSSVSKVDWIKIYDVSRTPTNLLLTASSNILSYDNDESSILTATVLDENDNPVNNVPVTFKKGSTVLDTVQSNGNGVATFTYNSQGVGDVEFIASIDGLYSDVLNIEDCLKYDDATTDKSSSYSYAVTNNKSSLQYDNINHCYNYNLTSNTNSDSWSDSEVLLLSSDIGTGNYYMSVDCCCNSRTGDYNFMSALFKSSSDYVITGGLTSNMLSKVRINSIDYQLKRNGALSTNTWYRFEITVEDGVVEGRITNIATEEILITFGREIFSYTSLEFRLTLCYYVSTNSFKNVKVKRLNKTLIDENITLSSNKSILSNYHSDTATLTATVLDDEDNPVNNETIIFYKNGTSIGSDVTDSNGIASVNYNSQGIGDVEFTCKARDTNCRSNKLIIEDCYLYLPTEASYTSTHSSESATMILNDFTFSSDNYVMEYDYNFVSGSGCGMGICKYSNPITVTEYYTCAYNGTYLRVYWGATPSSEDYFTMYSSPSRKYYHVKLQQYSTKDLIMRVDSEIRGGYSSNNLSYLDDDEKTLIGYEWKSGAVINYKNVKIKELTP